MAFQSRIFSDPVKPELLGALRAQLEPGERLAWAASPELAGLESRAPARDTGTGTGSRRIGSGIGKLDAMVILGGGYAMLGAGVMVARTGNWQWLSVPAVLLVFGVLGYLVARWIKGRARREVEGTVYGVTTRRALIVHTYPSLAVQTIQIDTITDVAVRAPHGDFADLVLQAVPASAGLTFRGIAEPARAQALLTRVIRDPQAVEQEIAASEAYALQMRQLMVRNT